MTDATDYLEIHLNELKDLMAQKSALAITTAQFVMDVFPRDLLPDWVEILANGNPEELDAVIEIALADMQEVNDDNDNL